MNDYSADGTRRSIAGSLARLGTPIELLLALDGPKPDGFLLAGRYTLLDHDRALQRVMPEVAARGLGVIVGGPYSSGALVGGPNFEFAPARPELLARVARIKAIADRYGVSVKALGIEFTLAHPAVAAVLPGASKPHRISEDRAALGQRVAAEVWRELREQGLVSAAAPLPATSPALTSSADASPGARRGAASH